MENSKEDIKFDIRDIFNGNIWTREFIRKQYGLIILICFLMLVFINNGYRSEKQHARILKLKTELRDIQYEYLTLEAELVNLSRQSTISDRLRASGSQIKESSTPATEIK